MYLNQSRRETLSRLLGSLQEFTDATELRREIGAPILELLRADHYVSYVWDPARQCYADDLSHTMSESTLRAYNSYYVAYDCVTPVMERLNRPAIVEREVGAGTLRSSTFFNEFLRLEQMTSGINLYLRDPQLELGDIRIWREPHRPAFDDEALHLLGLLQPALCAALRRCRREPALSTRGNALPSAVYSIVAPASRQGNGNGLSQREIDVARQVALGLPDKQIARELGISFTTVRTHLGHIYRKLGVANRVELARRLASLGVGSGGRAPLH